MVLQPPDACIEVWALPVSLATTQGISFDFFSSGYWDVSLPRVCFLSEIQILLCMGYPIRIPSDQCLIPAPRRVSPVIASFIASLCQGIHHLHFKSYRNFLGRYTTSRFLHDSVLFITTTYKFFLALPQKHIWCFSPKFSMNFISLFSGTSKLRRLFLYTKSFLKLFFVFGFGLQR